MDKGKKGERGLPRPHTGAGNGTFLPFGPHTAVCRGGSYPHQAYQWLTVNLSQTLHINDIVAKAQKGALDILCTVVSHDVAFLTRAYIVQAYVRPQLEYNSVTWSPYT